MKHGGSEYYPNQGGEATASSRGYEAAGAVGEKEPMPGPVGSLASDDGNHDQAAQSAFAAAHGRPGITSYPDNLSGEIESDDPTKGEGSTAMIDYPHAGPPERTTSVGGGGNPGEY